MAVAQPWTWRGTARRRLLSSPLELHDVRDVEALAGRVLEERLREWKSTLPWHRGEEALAYLIAIAWEISLDHDPELQAFSTRCYRTLRLRLVDWFRQTFGDSRHAPRPAMLSLDRVLDDADREELGADASSRRPAWEDALEDEAAALELDGVFNSAAFGLEWSDLSLEAFTAMTEIGRPLEAGKSLEAIARELGQSRRRVKQRLELLQAEILAKRPDLPEWLSS